MRGGRVDKNQKEITAALLKVGASVLQTTNVGRGFPDMVVGFRGKNFLIEVKNKENHYGRKGFNKNQLAWNATWQGSPPALVYSAEDALRAIGLLAAVVA